MAGVVINEFEAVAEPAPRKEEGAAGGSAPTKIEAPQLRSPLYRMARRAERLRAC